MEETRCVIHFAGITPGVRTISILEEKFKFEPAGGLLSKMIATPTAMRFIVSDRETRDIKTIDWNEPWSNQI